VDGSVCQDGRFEGDALMLLSFTDKQMVLVLVLETKVLVLVLVLETMYLSPCQKPF